jgi:hypothetical protein
MRLGSNGRRFASALGFVVVLGFSVPALAADVTGTWKWTVEFGGETMDRSVKLKQEGEKLTGTYVGRDGAEAPIEDGKVTGDKISFKVTRDFGGNKVVLTYSGKLTGDTIKGETKFERDGDEAMTRDWEAKRAK